MAFMIAALRAAAAAILGAALLAGCAERNPEALLASGKDYLAKNDKKAAVIQLKNALQVNPNLAEARFVLGKTLLEVGDVPGAEKELRKALELKYPAEEVVPPLARSLVLLGQYKQLTDEFANTSLTAPQGRAELQTALGTAYLGLTRHDSARAAFASALTAQPDHVPAYLGQARLAALLRDYPRALTLIDQALAKKPDYVDAWQLRGDVLQARGDQKLALESYRKAVAVQQDFVPGYVAMTSLFIQRNELEEAEKQVAVIKRLAPDNPQTLYLQALVAHHQKNFTAAREAIQQHLKLRPENLTAVALAGAIELELKAYVAAEAHLLKVLQRVPGHLPTRHALVLVYLRTGEHAKALDVLEPVLQGIERNPQMLALAGQTYMLNGDPERAADYFAKAAALDPADKRKRAALALSFVAKGETERGLRALEQAAAEDTGIGADLALTSLHMKRRDFRKALSAIASMEKKQPDIPAPHNLRGVVLLEMRDFTGGRRSFERAVELDPTYFPAVWNLAKLDFAEKNFDAARQRFEMVLSKNPQHADALLALAELRASTRGTSSEVVGLLSKAMSAHPADPRPRLALVRYYIASKEHKKAVAAAQEALAAMPTRPEILDVAGRAYQDAGESEQALSIYTKLASLQPKSPYPYVRMADAQIAARNKDAAFSSLQRALNLQKDLVDAQQRMILLHMQSEQVEQALAVARQVQKQRPKQSIGYVFEGDIHAARKNWTEAVQAYRRGLNQVGTTDLAMRSYDALINSDGRANAEQFTATWFKDHPKDDRFRWHVAQSALARKDYPSATQHYRKLVETRPDDPIVLNNLAWASSRLNDPNALAYAEKAHKLAPEEATFMDTLGMLLLERGDVTRGLELLRKASAVQPKSADIRLNLAKGLIKAGEKEAARKELDELAKLGDKFPAHAEVKQLRREL
jgi:putative PEP-CTERM system TPR-repeat lipoprotein